MPQDTEPASLLHAANLSWPAFVAWFDPEIMAAAAGDTGTSFSPFEVALQEAHGRLLAAHSAAMATMEVHRFEKQRVGHTGELFVSLSMLLPFCSSSKAPA
ncbi:hypothetical protein AK812_SmicGene11764 [Symbiodinium microadriaticum]|uniref:Uncharacterized protein n=1 Tax=Symbiodinium microadriaticum TaxID=2951 RepID=A0A1Q9EC69_SYMMI|nr:hypothetical protein AK812_SmicGene11764 [Symbiodinium microadriaticum]